MLAVGHRTFGLAAVLTVLLGCAGEDRPRSGPPAAGAPPDTAAPAEGRLVAGMTFPTVTVRDLDGVAVGTDALIRGADALVFFVSIGCESCEGVVQAWTERADEVPPGLRVFAITDEDPEFARRYLEEHPYPFTLYCDDRGIFGDEYKVQAFPTAVGITDEGRIAFVGLGVNERFTPATAVRMLQAVKEARD